MHWTLRWAGLRGDFSPEKRRKSETGFMCPVHWNCTWNWENALAASDEQFGVITEVVFWQLWGGIHLFLASSASASSGRLWVWCWSSVNANQTKVTSNRCKSDWLRRRRRAEKSVALLAQPAANQLIPHTYTCFVNNLNIGRGDVWSSERVRLRNRWFYLQNIHLCCSSSTSGHPVVKY